MFVRKLSSITLVIVSGFLFGSFATKQDTNVSIDVNYEDNSGNTVDHHETYKQVDKNIDGFQQHHEEQHIKTIVTIDNKTNVQTYDKDTDFTVKPPNYNDNSNVISSTIAPPFYETTTKFHKVEKGDVGRHFGKGPHGHRAEGPFGIGTTAATTTSPSSDDVDIKYNNKVNYTSEQNENGHHKSETEHGSEVLQMNHDKNNNSILHNYENEHMKTHQDEGKPAVVDYNMNDTDRTEQETNKKPGQTMTSYDHVRNHVSNGSLFDSPSSSNNVFHFHSFFRMSIFILVLVAMP